MKNIRGFASDNNTGVHSEVLEYFREVNLGHEIGYGDDPYTQKAEIIFKDIFGKDTEVFFVFTGTAANVLGLTAATQSYNSIICAETAHIQQDECGAPEKFSGCKVIPVPSDNGKLTVNSISRHFTGFGFEHHSQPGIVSISQPTEMGTVYTVEEIKALADYIHSKNMLLHIDGARLANAAVALGKDLRDISFAAGADVLSFGGTKNGLMSAESVVFANNTLAVNFKYLRKQGMQLASKMRFISAQFIAYFNNDLWKRNATHANKMAQMLAKRLSEIREIKITQNIETNGVFLIMPEAVIREMQKEFFFYVWDEETFEVRLMTSYDTTEDDIENFVKLLKSKLKNNRL